MTRNEACSFLTTIASDELIQSGLSIAIFKARDIVVCSPNKILDVLATEKDFEQNRCFLREIAEMIIESYFFSDIIRENATQLRFSLDEMKFEDCDKMHLPTRCKNCPCYHVVGEKNE